MLTDNDFQELLVQFPPMEFGFAYGSGVVQQGGYDYSTTPINNDTSTNTDTINGNKDSSKNTFNTDNLGIILNSHNSHESEAKEYPMVDLIFAVDDPAAWHSANMRLNPSHYTPLIPCTPSMITYMQDSFGAGMWYNAMVAMKISKYPKRLMKYGVISKTRYKYRSSTYFEVCRLIQV